MQSFQFKCPTEIVFGRGAADAVGEKIQKYGGHHVFIVFGGGSVLKSGLLTRVERILTTRGITFQVMGGVQPNPLVSLAREGVREAILFQADFVLAIGGGSVIDTAKAIAHGAANPGTDIWDFWTGKKPLTRSLPVGAILTLAAAGSETSDSAVLTNEEVGVKSGFNTEFNRPAVAFMDPELTYTVPKKQLVCGVSDILMHTMERYFTKIEGNELTDLFAEALLRDVIQNARIAVKDQTDYEAMSEIMWCGSVSHCNLTELGRKKDFSCHKLGHALSGKYGVTHGASLTSLWGWWEQYVFKDDVPRFARFAEKVWDIHDGSEQEKAEKGIAAQVAFFKELGMPTCFSELGIGILSENAIETLANLVTDDGSKTVGVFHPIGKQEAIDIYGLANH